MHSGRAHPVTCLVVLAVYLANVAFVAGGAVVCRDADREALIELACDHGHCSGFVVTGHDHHSAESCGCSACPCEDTPLSSLVTATLSRDDAQWRIAVDVEGVPLRGGPRGRFASHGPPLTWRSPPPRVPAQLGHLRTIVLIV